MSLRSKLIGCVAHLPLELGFDTMELACPESWTVLCVVPKETVRLK